MRSVALLRGDEAEDPSVLRAELEAWLLEAGRMEAVVDDALRAAGDAVADREASAAQHQAESVACRRALELHISRRSADDQAGAAREAEGQRAQEAEVLRLQAELAQARAEVRQMGEQHGRKLREAQTETHEALSREARLIRQIEDERSAARAAVEAGLESEEEARRAWAQARLAATSADREEETRRAWADERRQWGESSAAASIAAAERHDELFAALTGCRRQLEEAQFAAAQAEARAAAAADHAASAEGAREMSDGVWQEKLSAAQAEASLRRREAESRDEAAGVVEMERHTLHIELAEARAAVDRLGWELAQKDEHARALAAESAMLREEVATRDAQLSAAHEEAESLAEEMLTLKSEAEGARKEVEEAREGMKAMEAAAMEQTRQMQAAGVEETRRVAAEAEQRVGQQEARWIAQANVWREEMQTLRTQATIAEERLEEAGAHVAALRAEHEEELRKAKARLTMSEQAGGARAASLNSEIERLRAHEAMRIAAARSAPPPPPPAPASSSSPSGTAPAATPAWPANPAPARAPAPPPLAAAAAMPPPSPYPSAAYPSPYSACGGGFSASGPGPWVGPPQTASLSSALSTGLSFPDVAQFAAALRTEALRTPAVARAREFGTSALSKPPPPNLPTSYPNPATYPRAAAPAAALGQAAGAFSYAPPPSSIQAKAMLQSLLDE